MGREALEQLRSAKRVEQHLGLGHAGLRGRRVTGLTPRASCCAALLMATEGAG